MLVWMGDFNYRIDCTYEHAKELAHRNQLAELLAKVPLISFAIPSQAVLISFKCTSSNHPTSCVVVARLQGRTTVPCMHDHLACLTCIRSINWGNKAARGEICY